MELGQLKYRCWISMVNLRHEVCLLMRQYHRNLLKEVGHPTPTSQYDSCRPEFQEENNLKVPASVYLPRGLSNRPQYIRASTFYYKSVLPTPSDFLRCKKVPSQCA